MGEVATVNDSVTAGDNVTAGDTAAVTSSGEAETIASDELIVTLYDSAFDAATLATLATSGIANGDALPANGTATFDGYITLGDVIEGRASLSVDFANRLASGAITNMTYYDASVVAALSGQLTMAGQTVSRIGLKLDVTGDVSAPATGAGQITGTVRGVLHGSGPDGFSGTFRGTSTLTPLAGQVVNGTIYGN